MRPVFIPDDFTTLASETLYSSDDINVCSIKTATISEPGAGYPKDGMWMSIPIVRPDDSAQRASVLHNKVRKTILMLKRSEGKGKTKTIMAHTKGQLPMISRRDKCPVVFYTRRDWSQSVIFICGHRNGKRSKLFYLRRTHHTTKKMAVSFCTLHPPPLKMVSRLHGPHSIRR